MNIATKHINSSLLPSGSKARIKYTNNTNSEKTFIFWIEYLY